MLKSAMFSVEDMYPRLQAFRTSLQNQGIAYRPLYFAKVDVKACFDTIPQKRLMKFARSILSAETYSTAKYARSKLVGHNEETPGFGAKPSWRYLTKATSSGSTFDFATEVVTDIANGRTRTLYVDGVVHKTEQRKAILNLLEEHVESNLIKLGNRFYRQKEGIPQGSVVSSILCSFFYSELERQVLDYINDSHSLLLRLIDDFLVITTKRDVAERFMRDMHVGFPEFGVEVKAEKSRANFEMEIDGRMITKLPSQADFPYCGNAINTVTLDLSKDKERRKQSSM
jgi:telomerase reverse transcriptase